jgi:carboxyl-terminal processing protease
LNGWTFSDNGKQFSAQPSEIPQLFRIIKGVIVGSKQTYGKGTVQNVIDLNQFVRNGDVGDLEALKTTTQNFIVSTVDLS